MISSAVALRFVRYALVGLATNAVGYLVYLLVTWLGVAPKSAMTALYFLGASLGYISNRTWTFRYSGSVWRSSLKYVAFHAGGYSLNYLMLHIFADRLHFHHQMVQAAAIFVVAGYLFVAFNLFVFKTGNSYGAIK